MATCTIKSKTINYLKNKGALEDSRRVRDITLFNELVKDLTKTAYLSYGVGDNKVKLFNTEFAETKLMDGSYKTIIRAIPNEALFNLLEEQVTPATQESKINSIFELEKPTIKLKSLSAQQLVDNENPVYMKQLQDSLEKDIEDFNNFINCLWG